MTPSPPSAKLQDRKGLNMVWSGLFAPTYVVRFGSMARTMTADEILQMQFQQALAAQNSHGVQVNNWIYNLYGVGPSDIPPYPSLADRHAKLANGLEAAMGKFEERYGHRPGCPNLPAA